MTKSNSSLPFAASKRYYFGDFERNINTENSAVTDIDYIFADGGVSYSTVWTPWHRSIMILIRNWTDMQRDRQDMLQSEVENNS